LAKKIMPAVQAISDFGILGFRDLFLYGLKLKRRPPPMANSN